MSQDQGQAASVSSERIVSQSVTAGDTTAAVTAQPIRTHVQKILSKTANPTQSAVTVTSPFNLTYFGGPLVKTGISHPIYVNCKTGGFCWGNSRGTPGTFLADLTNSNFVHIVDQYIGLKTNSRYTLTFASSVNATFSHTATFPTLATVPQLLSIIHAVAKAGGTGYGKMYHVFLPAGTDTCLSPTVCYSPDNPPTFIFCAYHGSVQFSDIGHVLFSVEPFQGVGGCFIPTAVPHGLLDATASTLSHETFETITDPDPGSGWFNTVFGFEIGDECTSTSTNVNFSGLWFDVQSEYSNAANGCVNGV